ncbi:MAG: fasciclin domain-containing protein [Bacteroidota bacterium]|nr:fasciclin domain-containing protein [Bacteroidota bacterium]
MKFKTSTKLIALIMGMMVLTTSSFAQKEKTVMVGGAAMYPSKNIVENAVNSKDHTTLVAAVKAAGLVETLQSAGPFTVFAPTNKAFDKLPKGTVETLLKPENKAQLTAVLTYHVVPGKISSASLLKMIAENGGTYKAKTVQGGMLSFKKSGNNIVITDEKGGMSKVTIADVNQSNGVIHVIDSVLLPNG